jgi:hypothetical protein
MKNLGMFVAHRIVSEYAERIYAYIDKTQRDTKLSISRLLMVKHETLCISLISKQDGLDKAKNHFTLRALMPVNLN